MDVRETRATAVIVQNVPPAAADWFLEWQRGVTAAAAPTAGYRGTEVFPPAPGQRAWVVLIHFDDDAALQRWLRSPARAEWVAALEAKIGRFELQTLRGGLGFWFAHRPSAGPAPPGWKLALVVLLGLYPTVMLLTMFVGPYTTALGLAGSMLVGNALSVGLLQWAVMPALTAVWGRWLTAGTGRTGVTVGGAVLLVALLAAMTLTFHLLTG